MAKDKKTSKAVLYYTCVTLSAIAICWIIVVILKWPLLAEIPLSVSLFIHILALSKQLYEFWTKSNIQLKYNMQLIVEEVEDAEDSVYVLLDS